MSWYKIKTSDGAEHRLWFGHDPSEQDVLDAIKAPKISQGRETLPERTDEPMPTGIGGSPLQRMMGTDADPNSPEKLAQVLLALGTGPGSPVGQGIARAGFGVVGRLAQILSKPPVIAGAVGAAAGGLEHGPKGAAIGAATGAAGAAGIPIVGRGIGRFAGRAIAEGMAESVPAVTRAATNIEKTLIESGWTNEAAKKAAEKIIAKATAEAAPMVAATTPAQFNPESLQIIAKLRQLAQTSGANKIEITQAAQKAFPESWKEVMKMIMAPRTTMPTINVPPPR